MILGFVSRLKCESIVLCLCEALLLLNNLWIGMVSIFYELCISLASQCQNNHCISKIAKQVVSIYLFNVFQLEQKLLVTATYQV